MKQLSMLAVCALCGCGAGQSASEGGGPPPKPIRSCYVVVDDLGIVGLFVSSVGPKSAAPERVNSITFLGTEGELLRSYQGVPLISLGAIEGKGDPVQLRVAANRELATFTPSNVVVVIDGATQRVCQLARLVDDDDDDDENPDTLFKYPQYSHRAAIAQFGNCRNCLQSYLCGCLNDLYGRDLSETTSYCAEDVESLDNCEETSALLFDDP